jgi:hypothetical protein
MPWVILGALNLSTNFLCHIANVRCNWKARDTIHIYILNTTILLFHPTNWCKTNTHKEGGGDWKKHIFQQAPDTNSLHQIAIAVWNIATRNTLCVYDYDYIHDQVMCNDMLNATGTGLEWLKR